MTTSFNRGSCFWCSEDVGEGDWDYVGNARVWVCSKSECNRELQREQQGARDERFLNACEDDFGRY
jgi:hypothetical protein